MIKNLLFCVLAILVLSAQAQSPPPSPYVVSNIDWINYFSDKDMQNGAPTTLDANSNVYLTGYTGVAGAKELIVLKYDSTGVLTYSYPYTNGSNDEGKAIRTDAAGNAYIAGMSEDLLSGTSEDYLIIKLSAAGVPLWSAPARYDGGTGGIDVANAICVDASGDVYCTGKSQNTNGDYDIVTLKIDGSTGSVIWTHTFNGNNMDDEGMAIELSTDGQKVFITGYSTNPATGKDIVTYALNTSNGAIAWTSVITNGAAGGDDISKAMIVSGANVVICGEIDNTGSGTGVDYTTIKYNGSNGLIVWKRDYDKYNSTARATALARDSAANIGVVGIVDNGGTYEYHTVLYDSTGTEYAVNIETTGLGNTSTEPQICNDTIAHHWYISGERMSATKDIFVYQVTPAGSTSWRETIDGQNSDIDAATGIAVNGVGVVYVGALSKNSMSDFDFTTIKLNQTPVYWPPDFGGEPVNYNHLYLPNKGQLMRSDSVLASEVLYYTHNTKPEIFIEQDAFNFVFAKVDPSSRDTASTILDTLERMQYKFLGANRRANHHEYLPKSTAYNYFLGYALSPDISDIKGHERVFVPNFYPYIDLHYFSGAGGIKYYLVVKPGATIAEIRMQIEGAVSTSIDGSTGQLDLNGYLGNVSLAQPIAYTVDWLGQVVPITSGSAAWNSLSNDMYSIVTPTYNTAWPLIIQVSAITMPAAPAGIQANLDYSTYYGGQGNERFADIAVANNGDRHATGYTDSQYFPAYNSVQLFKGQTDVVFLKYLANDSLKYASFIGGSDNESGNSICVNSNNEVFVGGQTFSTDFKTLFLTGASNQTSNGTVGNPGFNQRGDGFLFKFVPSNPPGNQLVWSRYLGGSRNDAVNSIAVDGAGNLYLAGYAESTDMAMTNAHQPSMGTWFTQYNRDAIFGKFNAGLQTQWLTYHGGSNLTGSTSFEEAFDIAIDNSGRVIGCGWTEVSGTPVGNTTGNANTFYQNTRKGVADGFIIRYSPSGTPDFMSYFGGDGHDRIYRISYNSTTDQIFFAGNSDNASQFPFENLAGATNSQYEIATNAFVGGMAGDLTKQWCTYFGKGIGKRYTVQGLSVDNQGLVYLSGFTDSDTLQSPVAYPTSVVYKDSVLKGSEDGFIAIFNQSKLLYHAHYFGGSASDRIANSDVGQNQKLWVVGSTTSPNFPIAYGLVTAALIDSTYNGANDGFLSRFDLQNYQVTGVKQMDFDRALLTVYPNPANTRFYLELEGVLQSKPVVSVYNLMGQLIFRESDLKNITEINCESWQNGVYLININNNETQKTLKLIKN